MNKKNKRFDVEFISYSGKYPTLCYGELILKINGKNYKFGFDCDISIPWSEVESRSKENYKKFWQSGGSIRGTSDLSNMWAESGPWELTDVNDLPDWMQPHADELIRIFNENVPWGCCGGCI